MKVFVPFFFIRAVASTYFIYYYVPMKYEDVTSVSTSGDLIACTLACVRQPPRPCHAFNYQASDGSCQHVHNRSSGVGGADGFWTFVLGPQGFVFAMSTAGKIHFLKELSTKYNYLGAFAACEAETGHLVMDNRGQAWHDHIKHYLSVDFWIGADDRDYDGIYTWIDGSEISVPFWCDEQPDFFDYGTGETERCVFMRSTWGECWNDARCSQTRPALCEIRIP